MKSRSAVLLFVIGAAIGVAVTWKLTKTKYETIANDEIASVKKAYQKVKDPNISKPVASEEVIKETNEYISVVGKSGYVSKEEPITKTEDYPGPYIITPDEFAGDYEFDTVDITYFADGVLCDENNVPLEDIENTIGNGAVRHFGEYENDAVYVRNERLKCDYEILRDERKYADLKRNRPKEE